MADHNKPVLTSTYANFVSELDARFDDLSLGLDPAVTTASNLPVNSLRWNSVLGKDQKWNGSVWGDKSSFYSMTTLRVNNGTEAAPSISFNDELGTGIFKPTAQAIAIATLGQEGIRVTGGALYVNRAALISGNPSALNVKYSGSGTQYGIALKSDTDNTTAVSFFNAANQPVGKINQTSTNIQITGIRDLAVDNTVSAKDGFLTPNFIVNARNPIWRFGDATTYGVSYFQASSGLYGNDSIGIHFGTATSAGSKVSFTIDGRLITHSNIVSGVTAIADTGSNITVNGNGTTNSTAPYLTVNSRGMVAGDGSQFTSGGLLFASYRDIRTTAYIGGITMRVRNVGDVRTDPVQMEFRIGNTTGDSFSSAGNAALPAAPMTLSAAGNLTVSTSVTAPSFVGVSSQSNNIKITDPLSSQPDRNLTNITPSAVSSQIRGDFANASVAGTGGNYAGILSFVPSTGTTASTFGPGYQLAFGSSAVNGGTPQLRLRNGIDTTWGSYVDVTTSANIQSMLNASGSAPIYACRAWVNFNGTGTVAIRAGGNVSSITDNGVGDYTVNFTTLMPDANYSMIATGQPATDNVSSLFEVFNTVRTTSSIRIRTAIQNGSTGSAQDFPQVNVAIFR